MKSAAFALWLTAVAQFGLVQGQTRAEITKLIRESARRHHVDEQRTLALAWAESKWTDAVRMEENGRRSCGPLQVHEKYTPGICDATLDHKIDAGVKWFAELVRKHGERAEHVYQYGKP